MLAFTFPGQGSQKPGMGAAWQEHPAWGRVKEASEATGRDVAALLLEADAETLTQTQNAQLATFVLSMIVHDAATALGAKPSYVAGHSLGEYSALVAAGVLTFGDACRLVYERGEAMKTAADERAGTMYAVLGLGDEAVEAACSRADGDVWVANYNSNGQVIISGAPDVLERAGAIAKELGAKRAMAIPVGGAFHTPFMAPARDRLRSALDAATFGDAVIPVVANVDARAHSAASEWRELSSAQLCNPVRWRQTTETLTAAGVNVLVELGPGAVLTGLTKRNAPESTYFNVSEPKDLDGLLGALARLDEARDAAGEAEDDRVLGEALNIDDRFVVAPATGAFTPDASLTENADLSIGMTIGTVGETLVLSEFEGIAGKVMMASGDRATKGQPLIWVRPKDAR